MSGGDNETTREIKQANNGYFEDNNNEIIYDAWIEIRVRGEPLRNTKDHVVDEE